MTANYTLSVFGFAPKFFIILHMTEYDTFIF